MADPDFVELDEVGRTKAYFAGMDSALFDAFYKRDMKQLSDEEQKKAHLNGELPSPCELEVKS